MFSNPQKELLPRLKAPYHTEAVIVTFAEATPFSEAKRLADDLQQAGMLIKGDSSVQDCPLTLLIRPFSSKYLSFRWSANRTSKIMTGTSISGPITAAKA